MEALRTLAAMLLSLAALVSPGAASAFQEPAPSNVAFVQRLIADAAVRVVATLRQGDTVALRLPARNDRWLFEAPCAALLKAGGMTVVTGTESTAVRVDLGMASAAVRYGSMFREGLFGSQRVERTATVTLSGSVTRGPELMWSGTLDTLRRDTIDAGEIARLEDGAPASLRDEPPDETFFDRILEPFVIIGATGAAVYLLFHVRS